MSSTSLDILFEQIICSEQKAQERNNLINEVKVEKINCVRKVKEKEEELKEAEVELSDKTELCHDGDAELKLFTARLNIINDQKKQLLEKQRDLQSQQNTLDDSLDKCRKEFFTKVKTFCAEYDLCSDGQHQRALRAKEKLKQLQEKERSIVRDLEQIQKHREEDVKLEATRLEYIDCIGQRTTDLQKLHDSIGEEQEKVTVLETNRQQVLQLPDTDKEFKKLQAELEACKDGTMEGLCNGLEEELQSLQHALWQKQLQNKRHLLQGRMASKNSENTKPVAIATPNTSQVNAVAQDGMTAAASASGKRQSAPRISHPPKKPNLSKLQKVDQYGSLNEASSGNQAGSRRLYPMLISTNLTCARHTMENTEKSSD